MLIPSRGPACWGLWCLSSPSTPSPHAYPGDRREPGSAGRRDGDGADRQLEDSAGVPQAARSKGA